MKLNRTTQRTIEILTFISKGDGHTLVEIIENLNIPKSSAFDIIKTLLHEKMIVEDLHGDKIRYKIGINAFMIGSTYIQGVDMIAVSKDYLIDLANKHQSTAFIAVLDDYMVTYLYKYESPQSAITTANIASRRSLHIAALGKIMLANSSEEYVTKAIQKISFDRFTDNTITSVEKFLVELRDARIKGYAKNNREETNHQVAVASALLDYTGRVVGAISLVCLYDEAVNLEELGMSAKQTAEIISKQLGYKGKYNEK